MKDVLFLGQKAEAAAKEDISIAEDLLDTLRFHRDHCVGMAANMIGARKAIIAIAEGNRLTAMLNPEVVKKSPKTYKAAEGCLSIPGIHENVKRPAKVRIEYLDENLTPHDEWVEGFVARVIQHEFDHLEGKMFVDHVSPLRKQLIKKRLVGMAKGKFSCHYKAKANH
jgi:peptide deformylase